MTETEVHALAGIPTETITNNNGNGKGDDHQPKTVADLMADAGANTIKEDPTPETLSAVINKFSSLTATLDPVLRMAAQGDLIKKLKDLNVVGAGNMVKQAFRSGEGKNKEGHGFSFENPEPWAEEVNGAVLLDEIKEILQKYTALPEGAEIAIPLWIMFSWCHDSFFVSPILCFNSPAKRCGKTTALRIISKLVPRPLMSSNASVAAIFRSIEICEPTLILDELDTFANANPEINGIINAGHDRDLAFVLRCEVDSLEPKPFSVWCPKVFAGIGRRKDTLEDRSIIIPMKRKAPSAKVERIRLDRLNIFKPFRQKAARWADDYMGDLTSINPSVPEILNDRAQDNWRALIAIADLAGGDWPKKAREAALKLSGEEAQDDDSIQVQLLADIRDICADQDVRRISSEVLVRELVEMEDRPWPEYKEGKQITKAGVARILKPFGIKPKVIRLPSGRTPRGYDLEQFEDTFLNYLPAGGFQTATPATTPENKELGDSQSATQGDDVAVEKQDNSFKNNDVAPVAVSKGGIGEKEEQSLDSGEASTLFEDAI